MVARTGVGGHGQWYCGRQGVSVGGGTKRAGGMHQMVRRQGGRMVWVGGTETASGVGGWLHMWVAWRWQRAGQWGRVVCEQYFYLLVSC